MKTKILLFILIIAAAFAAALVFFTQKSNAPVANEPPVPPAPPSSDLPPDCGGCVGLLNNGETRAIVPTSRITLELPESNYDKNAVVISPADSMGETFGASAASGDWVRTFEAVKIGTTTISVPGRNPGVPAYTLTLRIVVPGDEWQDGMKIVTQDDDRRTVQLQKDERFLIQFGSALSWNLSFEPKGVITRVPDSLTTDGFQGVYEASAAGTAVLHAEWRPICKPGEMCAQFIVERTVNFSVAP